MCVLRRCLGLAGGRGAGVMTVRQGYLLDPDRHAVDLTTFRALAHGVRADARRSRPPTLARLEQALELVQGELLSDEAYATWAIEERSALPRRAGDCGHGGRDAGTRTGQRR